MCHFNECENAFIIQASISKHCSKTEVAKQTQSHFSARAISVHWDGLGSTGGHCQACRPFHRWPAVPVTPLRVGDLVTTPTVMMRILGVMIRQCFIQQFATPLRVVTLRPWRSHQNQHSEGSEIGEWFYAKLYRVQDFIVSDKQTLNHIYVKTQFAAHRGRNA